MQYTIQERRNHSWFFINAILFFCSIVAFEIGSIEQWFWPFILGVIGLLVSFFSIFYNGYCQGWELKRISLLEDNEDVKKRE